MQNYRLQAVPKRILIVRTDRIGDVILTLPMAQALRRAYPEATIGMLVQRYTADVVACSGAVDRILHYDDGRHPLPFRTIAALLRRENFDVVFHTHPRFRLALITRVAGIATRVGTGYRWYSFLFNRKHFEHRKDARFHELEYNLHLLDEIACPVDPADRFPRLSIGDDAYREVDAILRDAGLDRGARLVIVHPGSGNSARDWPAERFGHLVSRLTAQDGLRVIITGSGQERGLVRAVTEHGGGKAMDFAGRLTIRQLAALSKRAALFIANSTGPIHIAATMGTPVVGLYPQLTALSAARWGPFADRKIVLTPAKPAACRICLKPGTPCECMASISVDEVFAAAMRLLDGEQAQ